MGPGLRRRPGTGLDTTVVIVGAGHAGLAMSRRLTERSIDHVVLERGEVANSWRTERWDSLRLLTPNWLTRLPGLHYDGDDPHGYMTMPEVTDFITSYAAAVSAPVRTSTTVTSLTRTGDGYRVATDRGTWRCAAAVVASGGCNLASVPAAAAGLPATVASHTPLTYKAPGDLPPGGVLVVGASASGVQLAREIRRSGRPVTLAVGEHVRMPRTYRGRDIFWWTHSAGILDERYDQLDDLTRARHLASPQLVGSADRESVDLNSLAAEGVTLVGRLGRIRDGVAQFSGSLANVCRLADLKLTRLLDTFDAWAAARRLDDDLGPPDHPEPTRIPTTPTLEIDLQRAGIEAVVWATGYRPDHSWLDTGLLDRKGRLRHDGGIVTEAPGLYVVGLHLLRRRRSSFISGAGRDSAELGHHLHRYLDLRARTSAGS